MISKEDTCKGNQEHSLLLKYLNLKGKTKAHL